MKINLIFPSESDSGFGFSDDSNEDPTFRPTSVVSSASSESHESETSTNETVSTTETSMYKCSTTFQQSIVSIKVVTIPRELVWNLEEPTWYTDTAEVSVRYIFMTLDSPFQFFNYLFGDEIFEKILAEFHLYAVQKDPKYPIYLMINNNDLKKFVGICIIMSVVHLPNTKMYGNPSLENSVIKDTMSCNKFENICTNLHFSNNKDAIPSGQPRHNRLHKIRPVINHLNEKFATVPMDDSLSLDQQLCATKYRHYLKQYMHMKPHKWSYSVFVLSRVTGFAYELELYSGLENGESQLLEGYTDLTVCANVVVRLGRFIPENKHHRLYSDNYFTTPGLMTFCEKRGIYCLGTVHQNRLLGVKVPS
ncbi:hypothetical protein PR048_018694 [Dryococelus australis]|uniref:PiggyBac transposable element-derived protein domain-containing protein n=1 Tax=Dryococelus australis TaxID=614101 RepID=A0ABQ9HD47_9NEOP|nr:hypothetical protein PR048_018694 [Dryococelus australis]